MALLLYLMLAGTSGASQSAAAQARAVVRVERAQPATKSAWEQAPKSRRREIVRKEDDGRQILLRIVEHE